MKSIILQHNWNYVHSACFGNR